MDFGIRNQHAAPRRVKLGTGGVDISELGIGTWAWGDRLYWGYGRTYDAADLRAAFDVAVDSGIDFFDTAEVYGWGRSERFLGDFMRESGSALVTGTKFFPFPWRFRRCSLLRALRHSLRRLRVERVDLYQVHWPYPPRSVQTWASALADAVEQGLVRAVGVSNYNVGQMRRAYDVLQQRGIRLASNQIRFSLLHRAPETNGLLRACRELGVTVIAYSPMEQGLLTGKYGRDRPPPGARRLRLRRKLAKADRMVALLREIGSGRAGRSPAQVALNWVICKGAVPIPGVKNYAQAKEVIGAAGWRLGDDEVAALDRAAEH